MFGILVVCFSHSQHRCSCDESYFARVLFSTDCMSICVTFSFSCLLKMNMIHLTRVIRWDSFFEGGSKLMQMCMYFPYTITGWWFQIFFGILPRFFVEMIQFDDHIFQLGWFNHHLDSIGCSGWKYTDPCARNVGIV